MPLQLSPRTIRLVELIFDSTILPEVNRLLEQECGNNLPFCKNEDEFRMERIRFAAIKLSEGNLEKLERVIKIAQMDWRDLLMAADFGNDLQVHEKWAAKILESQ